MSITRHAAHPTQDSNFLCGRSIAFAKELNPQPQEIVDVGHQVNCPECRVVINFCRRCIAPGSYVLARVA